jgi:hypothetical protein
MSIHERIQNIISLTYKWKSNTALDAPTLVYTNTDTVN